METKETFLALEGGEVEIDLYYTLRYVKAYRAPRDSRGPIEPDEPAGFEIVDIKARLPDGEIVRVGEPLNTFLRTDRMREFMGDRLELDAPMF